jgi:uncharacterized membrane protein
MRNMIYSPTMSIAQSGGILSHRLHRLYNIITGMAQLIGMTIGLWLLVSILEVYIRVRKMVNRRQARRH